MDSSTTVDLPDVILRYLTEFLSAQDCVALALSGVFTKFDTIYGSKRRLTISKCFFLTPKSWKDCFHQSVSSTSIISFDASHCYWLPSDLLCHSISLMDNLEELIINDTKVGVLQVAELLKTCSRITKLSLSLMEEHQNNMMNTLADRNGVVQSFSRLTSLRLFTVAFNSRYYIDSWLNILHLLQWCQNCAQLHVEISYTRDYFNYGMMYDSADHDQDVIQFAHDELFPYLGWMRSLESFIFIKRGSHKLPHDLFLSELLSWMYSSPLDDRKPHGLQRLWVQEYSVADALTDDHLSGTSSFKSLLLGDNLRIDTTHPSFHQLEHLGGIGFAQLAHLPELKYIRGYCVDDRGLSEFCKSHPSLEHLHFDSNYHSIRGHWRLPKLKSLVYSCGSPVREVVEQLIESCPNIEALHIGDSGAGSVTSDGVDFLAAIRFRRLKTLSFSGFDMFDGPFLPSMLTQCPQLRSLHLSGTFEPGSFMSKLGLCLPLAGNLRDFRLQWDHQENTSDIFLLLEAIRKGCSRLERLVIYQEELRYSGQKEGTIPLDAADQIVTFAASMQHLSALCLSCLLLDSSVMEETNRRLAEEIIPVRPSFWFHVGFELPKENDPSVPRVHYDEIVHPINSFDSPPKFF